MTGPQTTIRVRRLSLTQALRTLAAIDLRVLLQLVGSACPSTGRVWTTSARLAEELALSTGVVTASVQHLLDAAFITLWSERGALHCYECGAILLRSEEPPANLPVARDP